MGISEIIATHGPSQDPWVLQHLIEFVNKEAWFVDVVLEIGTERGASARVWRHVFDPSLLITVDVAPVPEGNFDGITTVWGARSQDTETVVKVEELLAGRPVDLLFIDGGHTYDDANGDYLAYGRLVRPGGVIALHDIGAGLLSLTGGNHVPLVWDEIVRKGGKTVSWHKNHGTGAKVVQ